MKFRLPLFNRREFIKKTTTAGAVASARGALFTPTMLQTTNTPVGKKGQAYPDERRKHTDSKSGRTVWQLTNSAPGRTASYSYYNVAKVTPDGRWALYSSDRASAKAGKLNLFKMDLRTGESVQLTDSSDVETKDNVVMAPDGKEVYFFDEGKNLRVVDMESFRERRIAQLPETVGAPLHNSSISPDKKFLISSRPLEAKATYSYLSDWALHHALIATRTDNGQMHNIVEGMYPIGINEYCPTNPNLILYDIHGEWELVHRPWVINADGTGNRPVMLTIKGEGAGHQFWSWNGHQIYIVMNGGRYPQGLWTCNTDGSNERCVLIGGTHAHCAASPQDDRFVGDEMYGKTDALFISKKGSPQPEILCQTWPWFERDERVKDKKVIGTTPYHPHARFIPNGTAVAYSGRGANGAGNIFMVEL